MSKNDDDLPPDLKKFIKAAKNVEKSQEWNPEPQRRKFIQRIFLNKYFWIIVFILLVVICLASQGIKF